MGAHAGARRSSVSVRLRFAGLAAVVALLAVATACDAVLHPRFNEVEPQSAPVRVLDLSSDAAYAFVSATGPTATVPAAGIWRVDREDGSVVPLPNNAAWSQDGRRYLSYAPGLFPQVWEDGVVTTAPWLTRMSKNLRFGLVPNPSAPFRRWDLATGTTVDVEAGRPRPPGFTTVSDVYGHGGVSDDGAVVWFPLVNPTTAECITRFVHLDANLLFDQPVCGITEVSANGLGFVRALDTIELGDPIVHIGGPTRLELWSSFAAGARRVLQVPPVDFDIPQAWWFDGFALADSGWTLWAVRSTLSGIGSSADWRAEVITAASPDELVSFPADAELTNGDGRVAAQFSISADGRWFAYGTGVPDAPAHLLDRFNGNDESLVGNAGKGRRNVIISDDGSVVVSSEIDSSSLRDGSGWFEHEAVPVP